MKKPAVASAIALALAGSPATAEAQAVWWWCPAARAYYPQVQLCPNGTWQRVGPSQPQPQARKPFWTPDGQFNTGGASAAEINAAVAEHERQQEAERQARDAQAKIAAEERRRKAAEPQAAVAAPTLVCHTVERLQWLTNYQNAFWERSQQYRMLGAGNNLIEPPGPAPEPEEYGCTLIPKGAPIAVELTPAMLPLVTAQIGGQTIRGVTAATMYRLKSDAAPEMAQPAPPQAPTAAPDSVTTPKFPAIGDSLDAWCVQVKLPSSIAICSDDELRALAVERQHAYDEAKSRLNPEQ
jgi:hypothetical protein